METGLLDIPGPLLSAIDAVLAGFLPETARIVAWGIAAGAASMGLYWLVSPQSKIEQARLDSVAARRAMAAYEGDFDGIFPLVLRSLSTSFRHFGLALGPALLGSLPVIFLMVWMSGSFGFNLPTPGSNIRITAIEQTAPLAWSGNANEDGEDGWTVAWPEPEQSILLRDPAGKAMLALPLSYPVPIKHKRVWWNALFANPLGSLPENAPVEAIRIDLEAKTFMPFGPAWIRGWEALFILVVLLASIAIKVAFRIR